MSKYSEEHLKTMAEDAFQARDQGDPRYALFIMKMMMYTGLTQEAVEYKMNELKETGKTL